MTDWAPTAALFRVTSLCGALALLAVLLRRPDLLFVLAPLAVAAAVALLRGRPGTPVATFTMSDEVPLEGADVLARVRVDGLSGGGIDAVTIAVPTSGWVRAAGAATQAAALLPHDGTADIEFPMRALRWGRHEVGPAVLTVTAADGMFRYAPVPLPAQLVRVLPLSERFEGAADVPQARGSVGVHRSRRPGEGSDLSGVRPFGVGDRLRRINWRVSLRTDQLHVNATLSERDAEVILLLDARYDAGASQGIDGRASGVDIGVRAAAALARFYLRLGDRVGLITQGEAVRALPPRAGRAQLFGLLDLLLDVLPPQVRVGEPELLPPYGVDPRSLIVLLTPLVGESVFVRAAALVRAGHPLVVLDILPADAAPLEQTEWTPLALRLWRLQRSTRMHRLGELGVPVVPWQGPGTLDAVLRDLSRVAGPPRGLR